MTISESVGSSGSDSASPSAAAFARSMSPPSLDQERSARRLGRVAHRLSSPECPKEEASAEARSAAEPDLNRASLPSAFPTVPPTETSEQRVTAQDLRIIERRGQTRKRGRCSSAERRARPVGPSGLEGQPGQTSHEVELRRPRVAVDHWEHAHADISTEHDLGRGERLGRRIVVADNEPDEAGRELARSQALTRGQVLGNPRLDHETSVRAQVVGRGGEAPALRLLILEGEDRVDREHDERELRRRFQPDGGEVARGRGDPLTARLRPSNSSICSDPSMPCTVRPRSTSGSARRPVPTPSSRTGPPSARSASRSTAAWVSNAFP